MKFYYDIVLCADLTGVCGVEMLDTNTEIEDELKLTADVLEDDPHDAGTFVPVVARKISEEATIRKRVQERQTGPTHPEQAVPHWCG